MRLVINKARRTRAIEAADKEVAESYVVDKLTPRELRWLLDTAINTALDIIEEELA